MKIVKEIAHYLNRSLIIDLNDINLHFVTLKFLAFMN
jgi:hypothetical protein